MRRLLSIAAAAAFLFLLAGERNTVSAQVRSISVDAVAGEPFGVGRVQMRFDSRADREATRFRMDSPDGRVLYSAYPDRPLRGAVRNLLQIAPLQAEGYFLFTGSEPFELNVYVPKGYKTTVKPRSGDSARRAMLADWWRAYQTRLQLFGTTGDYPPQVENYLSAMLARRLDLELSQGVGDIVGRFLGTDQLDDMFGPLMGAEKLRLEVQRDTMLGKFEAEPLADAPLPEADSGRALSAIDVPADLEIEPIANHVPAECFYIRFGAFPNFIWLRKSLDKAGGDLANLVAVRGVNYGLNERFQEQIGLKESKLAEVLGPLVIADVALIGSDAFLREGAAMGMLFQAKNNLLLGQDIQRQRDDAKSRHEGAEEEEIEIGEHKVSFIHSPDGKLRSFYAVDGDYHFVTTSRRLVERFFEAGAGTRPLAAQPDFRLARAGLPLERGHAIFFFAGDPFFENLVSPEYRIEMGRRLRAVGNIELLQLAKLAAAAEGRPSETVDELIEGGFLPSGFGTLPDGSRLELKDGQMVDSRRGGRGYFTPLPDVEVAAASPGEIERYQEFMSYYRGSWGRLDPIAVGVHRQLTHEGKRERIELDIRMAPFTHREWWADLLGAPDQMKLRGVPGDLISVEFILGGQHLFLGLRDLVPMPLPWVPTLGDQQTLETYLSRFLLDSPANYLMAYFGGTSADGPLLDWLGDQRFGEPAADGIARGGELYRLETPAFVAFSFQRDILEQVGPQLVFEEAPRPAQGRIHVGDLSRTNVAELLDTLGGIQAKRTSESNTFLMDSLIRQLRVAPEDAMQVAEQLLDARLVDALGGQYELRKDKWGHGQWVSTELEKPRAEVSYQFPPLEWFRGLDADFALVDGLLSAHAIIDRQLEPDDIVPGLPEPEIVPPPDAAPAKKPGDEPEIVEPIEE